jgi:hypothetical protein
VSAVKRFTRLAIACRVVVLRCHHTGAVYRFDQPRFVPVAAVFELLGRVVDHPRVDRWQLAGFAVPLEELRFQANFQVTLWLVAPPPGLLSADSDVEDD